MSIYFSVAVGIVISVLLPLLRAFLPKPPKALESARSWEGIRPYVVTGVFSLLAAIIILAWMGDQLDSWSTAVIAGYTWDSTFQKLGTGNTTL